MQLKVVAFDGLSGSGKTTLITAIRQRQGFGIPHNFVPLDRWTPSLWAFRKIANENDQVEYLSQAFVRSNIPFGIVWCDAPISICVERLIAKSDKIYEPLEKMQHFLKEYFSTVCSVPYIYVDTICPLEQCVEMVEKWIQKL